MDALKEAIPDVIKLLDDPNQQAEAAEVLSIFAKRANLRDCVEKASPILVSLLEDESTYTQHRGILILQNMLEYTETPGALSRTIPLLTKFIRDENIILKPDAISMLVKISGHATLRDTLKEVIPEIIVLFCTGRPYDSSELNDLVASLLRNEPLAVSITQFILRIMDSLSTPSQPLL